MKDFFVPVVKEVIKISVSRLHLWNASSFSGRLSSCSRTHFIKLSFSLRAQSQAPVNDLILTISSLIDFKQASLLIVVASSSFDC
jgi:hypothetical protein